MFLTANYANLANCLGVCIRRALPDASRLHRFAKQCGQVGRGRPTLQGLAHRANATGNWFSVRLESCVIDAKCFETKKEN